MTAVAPLLAKSRLDSDRFGFAVYRGELSDIDDRTLLGALVDNEVDIAIVRVPAQGGGFQRLSRHGLHPIHADTLVVYQVDLSRYQPAALRNADLAFSDGTPADIPELQALVRDTFGGYVSHYHANPWLQPSAILDGYAEWASSYLSPGEDRNVWVARRGGVIVAFACCRYDTTHAQCEGVLYGVHPAHAGGGVYGDLIRYTQARYSERGFIDMKVSTQIWNLAVQKVWSREGFGLERAFDTYHVNAFISGAGAAIDRELTFTDRQVKAFAEITGDTNAIHLDEAAARAAGFETRLSHGMLAGGELSRIFGTERPGRGTLFLRSELAFIAPLYVGRTYRLRVRYIQSPSSAAHQLAVATVWDESGSLCLLAYNDLKR